MSDESTKKPAAEPDQPPAEEQQAQGVTSDAPEGGEPPATDQQDQLDQSHRHAAEAAEEAFFDQVAGDDDDDDEIDPELLRLPRPRRRRHPIIAIAVILLSGYLMVYLRADFLYYFNSNTAEDLGEASAAVKKGTIKRNAFVTVQGAPDRKHSVMLQGRLSGYDSFYRLLQTNNRVFVQQARKRRTTVREVSYSHTGRVVPFSGRPYLKKLREHFERTMTAAHDLPFPGVQKALSTGGARAVAITDRLGMKVTVRPDQLVWINVAYPKEWVIQFSRRHYASDALARKQLEGISLPFAPDDERSRSFRRFVVIADNSQIEELRRRFRDPALQVGIVRRQISYTAKWSQLRSEEGKLVIDTIDPTFPSRFRLGAASGEQPAKLEAFKDKPVRLSQQDVLYTTVSAKFVVPKDAVVIVTRDLPSGNWHYLLLYVVLAAFIVFNGIALVSRLRALRPESVR